MPEKGGRTLLISLGGGRYPRAEGLRHAAFERSSRAVASFLIVGEGAITTRDLHLDLFDDDRAWSEQVIAIREWLRERIPAAAVNDGSPRVDNILVHFVGHGMMKASSHEHYLSINSTDAQDRILTSASLRDLNAILLRHAPRRRRFYLVDACFAAASVKDLMGPVEDAMEVTLGSALGAWPEDRWGQSGVAALCSADRHTSASAAGNRELTQFTDGMLHVLETGDSTAPGRLSLRRIHALIGRALSSRYGDDAIQPLLVAPEDAEGGIAGAPVFANLAATGAAPEWLDRLRRAGDNEDSATSEPEGREERAPFRESVDPDDWPAPETGNAVVTTVPRSSAGRGERPADPDVGGTGGTVEPEQRFRQTVYRFFRLPHSRKEEIAGRFDPAGELGGLPDLDRYKAILARVRELDAVSRLEGMIGKAETT